MDKLLSIQDLVVRFYTYQGVVHALEGVDLEVETGETFGLVGETGCGKTLTALAAMMLVPKPGKVERGNVSFRTGGNAMVDMRRLKEGALRRIRGQEISMVFQEPSAALNPVYTVGNQISEVLFLHRREELAQGARTAALKAADEARGPLAPWSGAVHRLAAALYGGIGARPRSLAARVLSALPFVGGGLQAEAQRRSVALLRSLEVPDAERVVRRYPHELSGGMKQRVVIAMALACSPRLLIADEPTTSLDVTIQAQILALLRRLKEERGATLLYITHNLGVVAEVCDRVGVMYAGAMAEVSPVKELFRDPLHPYTKALLAALPRPGVGFKPIPGTVPDLTRPPTGCRFHPRCPFRMPVCPQHQPALVEVHPGHRVACYLYHRQFRDAQGGTREQESEARNPKSEARNPESEIR